MPKQSILDIHRRSGDANIGQTLLRLARLAETVGYYSTAEQIHESHREERAAIEEFDLGEAVIKRPRVERNRPGGVHTEVDR